jgi:hypothetical protein
MKYLEGSTEESHLEILEKNKDYIASAQKNPPFPS